MNETLNFDYDTEAYIVEPSQYSYNDLIVRGIATAYRAGKVPRDI
jgi:hypothetical protein